MLGWELPPHNSGGLGVACYHLSKALALKGTSIDFVVPYSAPHEEIDFMTVHNATTLSPLHKFGMGAYDSKFVAETTTSKGSKSAHTIRDIQARYGEFVEDFVAANDFDAIHAHDWLTMEAGMRAKELTNKPLVVHVHATEFDRAGGNMGNPIVHEIEYQGLIMADRIFAVSAITKQIIVDKYNIPADKVEVVYNAIDTLSFDQDYEYDMRTFRYLEGLSRGLHDRECHYSPYCSKRPRQPRTGYGESGRKVRPTRATPCRRRRTTGRTYSACSRPWHIR